jgi:cytochrome c biogenesis protein
MKAIIAAVFTSRFLTDNQINSLTSHKQFNCTEVINIVVEKCIHYFRQRRFTVSVQRNEESVLVDARKGMWREIGSALLHVSLLPLLIGGLIGKTTGFSYMQLLSPGESVQVRSRQFWVRCDFFELERNEHGQIKDYKSGLTLLDTMGDTLVQKVIEVNHPLVYRGIKMYQSSYRTDPESVDNIRLVVTGPRIGPIGKGVILHPGEQGVISGTDVTVLADRFMPDFVFDMESKTAQSRSLEHNNPACFVTVRSGGDTLFSRWVFQKFGAMHRTDSTYNVTFESYDQRQSTGLLIKENPGSSVVWCGIIFMSIGILLVFWVSRRRYWIAVEQTAGDTTSVTIGCSQSRDDPNSEERFEVVSTQLAAVCTGK